MIVRFRRRPAISLAFVIAMGMTVFSGARATPDISPPERIGVWRALGHLQSTDGSRFDVALLFFRSTTSEAAGPSDLAARAIDASVIAIVDEEHGTLVRGVRVDREADGLASAGPGPFDAMVDGWSIAPDRLGPRDLRLHVTQDDAELDLTLRPRSPAVALATSHLRDLALTQVVARGKLVLGERRVGVRGTFSLERQSSATILGDDQAASEHFTIALDDGRALFVDAPERTNGTPARATRGTFVDGLGRRTELAGKDIVVENSMHTVWHGAHGADYPSLFEVSVPKLHLDFAVVPVLPAQELDFEPRGAPFYLASCAVERAHPGPRDSGAGYVEVRGAIRPSP